jgi:hypothetical protein
MFLASIWAMSLGGTGWLALALVASEPISSLLQPAKSVPADSATDVKSARTKERLINAKPHTQRAAQTRVGTLKPLNKILSFRPSCRKPRFGLQPPLLGNGEENLKTPHAVQLRLK